MEMTKIAMTLYSFSFLLCGFNILGSAFFTGLNNGKISAIISVLRTLVIQVVAILLLPIIVGMDGIWLVILVAEGLTFVITVAFLLANKKRYGY